MTSNSHNLDRDVLVTRLLDGRAGESDWLNLRDLSMADPSVWGELTTTCRLNANLGAEIDRASASADNVALPHTTRRFGAGGSFSLRLNRSGSLGWALAAALGLAFVSQFVATNRPRTNGAAAPNTAGLINVSNADQALDAYMDMGQKSGRVVGEIPQRFVIDSRPIPASEGGGTEVTYLRQLIEKTIINDTLYRVGSDENGRPVLVPAVTPTVGAKPNPF